MTAYIFLAGAIKDYSFIKNCKLEGGVTICADSGFRHMRNLEIAPNYIVGDMDSITKEEISEINNAEIIQCLTASCPSV